MDRLELYTRWLASRPAPAEVMAGLHAGFDVVRMSDGGMEAVRTEGRLAAGGYDEDRAIYDNAAFGAGVAGVEPRTVHLGIDIFAPVGTEAFAPVAGRVHSFADNANPLDYGPTVILEHTTGALVFYTLYGHLGRESLVGLREGKAFAAGERLGWLGAPEVNGGWPPHLHFQVVLDMMHYCGDFPGVFRRSERDHWKTVCPDPGPLLGIAP